MNYVFSLKLFPNQLALRALCALCVELALWSGFLLVGMVIVLLSPLPFQSLEFGEAERLSRASERASSILNSLI